MKKNILYSIFCLISFNLVGQSLAESSDLLLKVSFYENLDIFKTKGEIQEYRIGSYINKQDSVKFKKITYNKADSIIKIKYFQSGYEYKILTNSNKEIISLVNTGGGAIYEMNTCYSSPKNMIPVRKVFDKDGSLKKAVYRCSDGKKVVLKYFYNINENNFGYDFFISGEWNYRSVMVTR